MKSIKFLFFILFIVAIIPPLILILINNPLPSPGSDAVDYNRIAINLLEGNGFHCDFTIEDVVKFPNIRHPLYPIFIAIIYSFTNCSFTAVKIAQVLLHGLTCIVIFLIAGKIFKDRFISFGAGLIWALYPLSISSSVTLLSETFLTFLLVLSVWFILRYAENPDLKNSFFAGLFLGLTALAKSILLVFPPALFLWFVLFFKDKFKMKLKRFLIVMLFMLVTISPWLIRNYFALGRPFPIATGSGLSFYRYNNEKTLDVVYSPLREAFPFTEKQKKEMSALSETQLDKYLYKLGWQFIKTHPKDFIRIRLTELCFFWRLWPVSPERFVKYYSHDFSHISPIEHFKSSYLLYFCKILYHMPYDILFLGMFVTFVVSFKKDKEEWKKALLLFLLIATINAVYIFHHGTDRYRMPIDPYVFILGLNGAVYIAKNIVWKIKR